MTFTDEGLQTFLSHLKGGNERGSENAAVVAYMSAEQPAELQAFLDVLAHWPAASFDTIMLRIHASVLQPFQEMEGALEIAGSSFDVQRALVVGEQDSARFLVAAWSPGDARSSMFEYEREGGELARLHGGLVGGLGEYLSQTLDRTDDFFELEVEDAEAALLDFADDSPALVKLFFSHVDLEDEELFMR